MATKEEKKQLKIEVKNIKNGFIITYRETWSSDDIELYCPDLESVKNEFDKLYGKEK